MTKGTKIWLWCALVLCALTTILTAASGRWLSVAIAVVSLGGLCVLLFTQKKWGFILMCVCYILSFCNGVYQGVIGESGMLAAIVMSFIGSALVPVVTYLFLRKSWNELK